MICPLFLTGCIFKEPLLLAGVVTNEQDHTLCTKGRPLTPEQAHVLVCPWSKRSWNCSTLNSSFVLTEIDGYENVRVQDHSEMRVARRHIWKALKVAAQSRWEEQFSLEASARAAQTMIRWIAASKCAWRGPLASRTCGLEKSRVGCVWWAAMAWGAAAAAGCRLGRRVARVDGLPFGGQRAVTTLP